MSMHDHTMPMLRIGNASSFAASGSQPTLADMDLLTRLIGKREQQIAKFARGVPGADEQPISALTKEAARLATLATEDLTLSRHPDHARIHIEETIALLLAAHAGLKAGAEPSD